MNESGLAARVSVAMHTEQNLRHLARRTAQILLEWLNVSPLAKHDNGERSVNSAMGMMLGVMAHPDRPPPADAAAKIEQHVFEQIRRREHIYYVLDVDYGPGNELVTLTRACGLDGVTWPIKSTLTVTTGANKHGTISNRRGYQAKSLDHILCPAQGGWLLTTDLNVDDRLHDIVVPAVQAGHAVGTWEPFAVENSPAG